MFDLINRMSDQILSWKQECGDVYLSNINNNIYIFRLLTRGEYFSIISLQNTIKYDVENFILKNCVLYPDSSLQGRLAGEVDYIIKKIIDLSGFAKKDDIVKDIESSRNNISILDNQIIILICKAFPHITPEEIDKFNYNKLLRYISISEAILDTKLIIEKPTNTIDFDRDNVEISGKPYIGPHAKKRGDVKR